MGRNELGWGMQGDASYFHRRANEERVAAMRAAHQGARRAHLEMAERYAELASAIGAYEPRLTETAG